MNKGFKLTTQLLSKLAELYKSGKTTTELAAEYGISKATVCRGLRKMGIEPERTDNLFVPKSISEEQKTEIIDKYKNGISIKDLKDTYELTYDAISKLLEEAGLYHPTPFISKTVKVGDNVRRFLNLAEQMELCEKYVSGPQTREDLAKEYQIHSETVGSILRRNNCSVKKYVPEIVVDQFCEEYEAGTYTMYEIAHTYTLPLDTVKHWLTKRGLADTLMSEVSPAEGSTILSRAEIKKMAKAADPAMLQFIIDLVYDPMANPRTKLAAALAVHEIAYGKAKEEPEEAKEEENTTDKILSLIDKKKLFNK